MAKATKKSKRKSLPKSGKRPQMQTDLEAARNSLPFFVTSRRGAPASWWNVEPTGDYTRDFLTGCRYAGAVLPLMKYVAGPPSLSHVVSHMQIAVAKRRGPRWRRDKWSGIEKGFLNGLGDLIVAGLACTAMAALGPEKLARRRRMPKKQQDAAFKFHDLVANTTWNRRERENRQLMQTLTDRQS